MKILYLAPLNHNRIGGIYVSIENRYKELQKKLINIDVYSIMEKDTKIVGLTKHLLKKKNLNINYNKTKLSNFKYSQIFYKNSLKTILLAKYYPKSKAKKIFMQICKEVDFTQYDFIHIHWAFPHGYIGKLVKDKFGIKYILTVHGSDIHSMPFQNKRVLKPIVEALEKAEKVVFVSKNLLRTAQTLGYSGKNAMISPNGINIETINILDKIKVKTKLRIYNKKVVGFVGSLTYIKRADKLGEVLKEINKLYVEVEFLIVGDGEYKERIQQYCSLHNLKITFTGQVLTEKVYYYMNAMDVMILPSRNEGWPCVVLEANACGVPVVATNVGGIPEALGEYGALVNEQIDYEKKFAQTVVEVLDSNYSRRVLRERALEYDWSKIVEKEYEVYKEILKEK